MSSIVFLKFVEERIREALTALSYTCDDAVIMDAAKGIRFGEGVFKNPIEAESSFFNFKAKAEANKAWFSLYGISSGDWAKAALKQPQLFYQSPETLRNNFEANVAWLFKHGVSAKEWAEAALKQPTLFYHSPETLQEHFKANTASYFRLRHKRSIKMLSRYRPLPSILICTPCAASVSMNAAAVNCTP